MTQMAKDRPAVLATFLSRDSYRAATGVTEGPPRLTPLLRIAAVCIGALSIAGTLFLFSADARALWKEALSMIVCGLVFVVAGMRGKPRAFLGGRLDSHAQGSDSSPAGRHD